MAPYTFHLSRFHHRSWTRPRRRTCESHGFGAKNETLTVQYRPRNNGNSASIPTACSEHPNAETNHFEEPIEEDLKTCRREADKLPQMAILVAVISLCERYAYYGFLGILREHHGSFKTATDY
jgi:hypothetical protein